MDSGGATSESRRTSKRFLASMRAASGGKEGSGSIYWLIAWPPCMQRAEASKEVARFIAPRQAARRNQSDGGNSVQNLISTRKTTYLCNGATP